MIVEIIEGSLNPTHHFFHRKGVTDLSKMCEVALQRLRLNPPEQTIIHMHSKPSSKALEGPDSCFIEAPHEHEVFDATRIDSGDFY